MELRNVGHKRFIESFPSSPSMILVNSTCQKKKIGPQVF